MTVAERIILRNADAGVTFYRDGDALRWEPPVTFTPEQLDCLKRHKAELLALVDAHDAEVASMLFDLPCARLTQHEIVR